MPTIQDRLHNREVWIMGGTEHAGGKRERETDRCVGERAFEGSQTRSQREGASDSTGASGQECKKVTEQIEDSTFKKVGRRDRER